MFQSVQTFITERLGYTGKNALELPITFPRFLSFMLKKILFAVLLAAATHLSWADSVPKTLTIKAAVAEGFIDGLHAKYLHFLADELDATLELSTMPFARRIKEMRKGNLDIMVGIQQRFNKQDEFIYIEPFYETLSYRFFTLQQNQAAIAKYQDLKGRLVGVNRHSRYFPPFADDKDIQRVDVSSLKQSINLLLHERIDVFVHYQESTLPTLIEMGLEQQIVKTQYQPAHGNEYYVAITEKSSLIGYKSRLEEIITNAIKNGDFARIRKNHYQQRIAKQ